MRIGILGHFGGDEYFTDGQTVKVKSLYSALIDNCRDLKIDIVDTYYIRHNRIKLLWAFTKMLFLDRVVIFLPAYGGRRVLFRLFFYLSKYCGKRVYHDCIAGSLDQEISEHPKWIKYLNQYEDNWMESPQQVEMLKSMGIRNVSYLANFKRLQPVSFEEMSSLVFNFPYKFCIFSRIEPMKGIEDALIAIKKVNEKKIGSATLDIYGPVQQGQESWFEEIKQKYGDLFQYKGIADPQKSVEVLKGYFALIFSTRYYTEGMPGTIIDAMFAGLPVISRKWAWCDNMLKNNYNGIVYDFDKPQLLDDIIVEVCEKPEIIIQMKENCIVESERYTEQNAINIILGKIKLI